MLRKYKPLVVDGGKWVCMNERFNVEPSYCRVLSFGIGDNWSFDDEMDKKYGCEVIIYTFTRDACLRATKT